MDDILEYIELQKYQDKLKEMREEIVKFRKRGRDRTILADILVFSGILIGFYWPWALWGSVMGLIILVESMMCSRRVLNRQKIELDEIVEEIELRGVIVGGEKK